jgi:hypothetical protein
MAATARTARTAPTGLFGLPLRADNPLLLAAEGALFAAPPVAVTDVVVPEDDWALALDFSAATAATAPAPTVEAPALVVADLPVATYAVHYFDTTAQALAAVDRDEVAEGDVLVADEESVAGVLVGSWVVAVTDEREDFELGTVPAAFAAAAAFAVEFMA